MLVSPISHGVQVGVYSHTELGQVKFPGDEGQGRDMPSQAQHMLAAAELPGKQAPNLLRTARAEQGSRTFCGTDAPGRNHTFIAGCLLPQDLGNVTGPGLLSFG